MKKYKNKLLIGAAIIALLALAFWYGGDAPGARGWEVNPTEAKLEATTTPTEAVTEAAKPTEKAEEITTAATEAQETTEETEAEAETEAPTEATTKAEEKTTQATMDKYLTDPIPEGKPKPVEPQDVTIGTNKYTCTLSISCSTILDNMDFCDENKKGLVPEDGWILKPISVTFYEGESVFNVLMRTCKQQGIHMEYMNTPIYNSAYIEGIGNLYEFDCGPQSGWMYSVNDVYPGLGCSAYTLADGDVIVFSYTCDLGADLGAEKVYEE